MPAKSLSSCLSLSPNYLSVAGRGLPKLADKSILRRYPCQRVDISGHSDLPHARTRKEQLLKNVVASGKVENNVLLLNKN